MLSPALHPWPPIPAPSGLCGSSFVNVTFHPISRSQQGKRIEDVYKASTLGSLLGAPFFMSCRPKLLGGEKQTNNKKNPPRLLANCLSENDLSPYQKAFQLWLLSASSAPWLLNPGSSNDILMCPICFLWFPSLHVAKARPSWSLCGNQGHEDQ